MLSLMVFSSACTLAPAITCAVGMHASVASGDNAQHFWGQVSFFSHMCVHICMYVLMGCCYSVSRALLRCCQGVACSLSTYSSSPFTLPSRSPSLSSFAAAWLCVYVCVWHTCRHMQTQTHTVGRCALHSLCTHSLHAHTLHAHFSPDAHYPHTHSL